MATAFYYVDSATCLANANGFAALCQTLNGKGLITDREVEAIRHEQLQQISKIFDEFELPSIIAELLEQRREVIERFWDDMAGKQNLRVSSMCTGREAREGKARSFYPPTASPGN